MEQMAYQALNEHLALMAFEINSSFLERSLNYLYIGLFVLFAQPRVHFWHLNKPFLAFSTLEQPLHTLLAR